MHEKEKKAEAAADGGKGTTRSKRTRLATRRGTMPFPPAGTAPHNRTRAEFGAGWKCLWRFDVAHCAVLFLPAGEPLGNASAIALRWAAHFWAHSLNRSSAATFAAFNPSAVDDTNLLIRIALVSSSYLSVPQLNVGSGRVLVAATNHFLWLRRHDAGDASLSLERALPGEDARGVWVDAHSLFAVYNRLHLEQKEKNGYAVRMHVRNLSDHRAPEVTLRIDGEAPLRKEKNWAPFAYGGTMYFSYALHPRHVVLACDLRTGVCVRRHSTSSDGVWAALLDGHGLLDKARLSTPPLTLPSGQQIGVGHAATMNGVYMHFLYEMERTPPFAIVRTSRPFRFFSTRCPRGIAPPWRIATQKGFLSTSLDAATEVLLKRAGSGEVPSEELGERTSCGAYRVQYVAGMHLTEGGSAVVFTYGVSDLAPMRAVVNVGLVVRLLSDGGDGTMRYPLCLTRKTPSYHGLVCDDSSCNSNRSEADGATIGFCLTLCDRWPYSYSSAAGPKRCANTPRNTPAAHLSSSATESGGSASGKQR